MLEKVKEEIIKFNQDRDWDQFHSPENLAKSIVIESGELLECFQWDNKEDVCDELADVVNYCILMADKLDVDLEDIVLKKLKKSEEKYPVDRAKGNSKKYNQL
ncbi:nucleotide pyrophosphohydrolase [Thomasclavelia cocleata]|uniref:nucleotide pyrophosphohydrolase n=1 Tax=Thomasclavelia cocleata TaxID=69824 RepID=UPI00255AF05B|nr:nucleotide pyrophosphohydrolase [Thomasclavelia cocleata]